ncbi:molybdopterin molybdotransferase MoeA [Microvirga antarctica]|uniref:molybdopterin molybdotransferase MoeA n=1 Tax=Microvirga antarctica TaxID=2819233 RepID=UPI001B309C9B|nr:gephyrin-like molybdotransferase Glp [Microvirga antarctica]
MTLLAVADALRNVLAGIAGPTEAEDVALSQATGRVLADNVAALRDQPPFSASAMDGYAVRFSDLATIPARLNVVGTSAAGQRFSGSMSAGQAVRIFTGAPVPEGADTIVMQENTQAGGDAVSILEASAQGRHIRPAGLDFKAGEVLLSSGRLLDARDIALAAAMGHGHLKVRRRPRIAILATGDELVLPGEVPGPDQITAASLPALVAMAEKAGAEVTDLGIAGDTLSSLDEKITGAQTARADMLVTLGGASVGDHDLVQQALARRGMALGFWRVALRPGKPLMHGQLGSTALLGLPGNPVSSLVCAILFLVPAIHKMLARPDFGSDQTEGAILGADLPANGDRQDYMRASLLMTDAGPPVVTPHAVQDSSMLAVLARSDALLVRAPHATAARAGDPCRIIRLARYC